MTRARTVVTVVAAVTLVAGVLWVRGDTAAVEGDLAGPTPSSPSPAPSEAVEDGPAGPQLDANGVEGLRLGVAGASLQALGTTPAGCTYAWPTSPHMAAPVDWDVAAWLMDGLVVSVSVAAWEPEGSTSDLTTWLGPTLGSPVEAAAELPAARTVVARPFGADGTPVTVVTVPGRGVETVFSDAAGWPGSSQPAGEVTTIEVRHPDARACVLADLPDLWGSSPSDAPVLDLDGIDRARLGEDVDALVAAGHLVEDVPVLGDGIAEVPGCRSFATAADPPARVVAVDGRVVHVQIWGPDPRTTFGVPSPGDVRALREVFGDLEGDEELGDVTAVVAGTTVTMSMWPPAQFVAEVDRPLHGGTPVVHAVSVTAPGVDAASIC